MDPFSEFKANHARASAHNAREAALARKAQFDEEKRRLDREQEYTEQQREAMHERRTTLELARSAQVLLLEAHAQPDTELVYQEPVYEKRGLFRKLTQVGTRKQIALEGWRLDMPTPDEPLVQAAHHLFLTPFNSINDHSALVWRAASKPVNKQAIHPLSTTPLTHDDMPWPVVLNGPKPPKGRGIHRIIDEVTWARRFDDDMRFIRAEISPAEIERLALVAKNAESARDRIMVRFGMHSAERGRADYQLYKKEKVEQRIRKALAEVAARYT